MTFAQAFYLFILPIGVAIGGAAIAYWHIRADKKNRLHPGE